MKTIILIGDSIRMGYLPYVRQELEGEAEVWGPEINGGDSRNVLAHLDDWLGREAALVHLNCGLHDLKREFDSDATQVPLTEYSINVEHILSRIKAAALPVIWATTTPVNEKWHHENKPFDRREEDVRAFNESALEVTRRLQVPVDDLHAAVLAMGRDEHLQPDGVHFSDAGYRRLGHIVADAVRRLLA
jgi:lysophospholipase L1-like esterase